MQVQKKFAWHFPKIQEIEDIEKLLLSLGSDSCDYDFSLQFDDEKIDVSSKEEFISIIQLKGLEPNDFRFYIFGKRILKEKSGYEHTELIYTIAFNAEPFLHPPYISLSVKAPEVEKAYLIITKIEEILALKKVEKIDLVQNNKVKSVFVAHSFDKRGKAYGQALGKFLTLLGFDVKSGERYSPERVDSKIKKRVLSQEILMTIYSPKLDYTWLHQEAGGGAFADKPIFILRENGIKIKEGIFKGREPINFPSGNIEKAFIRIMEGLEEIDYW